MTEFYNQTTIHPVGASALAIIIALMLFLPRAWAILPAILLVAFVPTAQRVVVVGADFHFLRILVLFGWMRVLARQELRGFRFVALDYWQTAVVAIGAFIYITLRGDTAAVIYRMGYAFDAIGMYLLFRVLIRGPKDVSRVITSFAVASILVGVFFFIEWTTRRNMFSVFGGVPSITQVRDGRLRCQGAFSHAILAGAFWATMLPLFIARWWTSPRQKTLTAMAIGATLFIVFAASSSTPVMSVIFGFGGWALYTWRHHVRTGFWALLGFLIVTHFAMQGPVWSLVAKINIVSGSTGWHRYHLIDQAIAHFGEWWLLGTESTANWDNWGQLRDVTNQYVYEGVHGGIWTLLAFVGLIVVSFLTIGKYLRATVSNPIHQRLGWGLGVMLFVHTMNFIAVTYFAQMILSWVLTLAIIAAITPMASAVKKTATAPARRVAGQGPREPRFSGAAVSRGARP